MTTEKNPEIKIQHGLHPGKPALLFNVILFISFLTFGAVLSLIIPKQKISELEKRELAAFPELSIKALFAGTYTNALDMYYSDNFPMRESLMNFSSRLRDRFGFRTDDIKIYNFEPKKEENKTIAITHDSLGNRVTDSLQTDSGGNKIGEMDTIRNDGEFVNSIFIYKGRGYQIFGGNAAAGGAYANMINNYHRLLGDSVTIHCLVIPSAIDYYLPDKYKGKSSLEKPNIDLIYSKLDPGIQTTDAWTEISKHTGEYLYYHTDHHWTVMGAYYAYRAFCNSAGFTPYETTDLTRKVKRKFIGSLYDLTRDSRLLENKDSVEYFLLPVNAKVQLFKTRDLKTSQRSALLVEMASGANSYSVFLGGDYPLLKAVTDIKNGKRILIIKDSFGNAIAPFFALHYEEVYIIDYRYFESNIPDLIRKNKITDLLFLHNTFMANSKYTVKKETYLMKTKGTAPQPYDPKADTLKK